MHVRVALFIFFKSKRKARWLVVLISINAIAGRSGTKWATVDVQILFYPRRAAEAPDRCRGESQRSGVLFKAALIRRRPVCNFCRGRHEPEGSGPLGVTRPTSTLWPGATQSYRGSDAEAKRSVVGSVVGTSSICAVLKVHKPPSYEASCKRNDPACIVDTAWRWEYGKFELIE